MWPLPCARDDDFSGIHIDPKEQLAVKILLLSMSSLMMQYLTGLTRKCAYNQECDNITL